MTRDQSNVSMRADDGRRLENFISECLVSSTIHHPQIFRKIIQNGSGQKSACADVVSPSGGFSDSHQHFTVVLFPALSLDPTSSGLKRLPRRYVGIWRELTTLRKRENEVFLSSVGW